MIIKNLTGAGGNKARNFLANKAKSDGMTTYWGPADQLGALLKIKGVRYDPSKFRLIGAGDTTYFTLARSDSGKGIKSPIDLIKADGLIGGSRAPMSQLDSFGRAPLALLNLGHRHVPGYRGQAKLNPALRAKKINYLTTGNRGY